MATPVMEDLERLASRLALLTSEDGEAENAGRAVGQLARRLGLSGGQLKAIFLAGVQAAGVPLPRPEAARDDAALERAESEAAELRRLLDRSDSDLQLAHLRLSDAREENETLRDALDRHRSAAVVARVAAGGAAATWLEPNWIAAPWRRADGSPPAGSSPTEASLGRMAMAGAQGTDLFARPDLAAAAVAHLPRGAPLPVRQLLWRGFSQWVETETMGRTAYAPAAQVDLR
jgi:hypothetical protein